MADLPQFRGWTSSEPEVEAARAEVAAWDGVYTRESRAAAIYETWRAGTGEGGRGRGGRGQTAAAETTGSSREQAEARLKTALESLRRTQGSDKSQWRWGRMHTRAFAHAFVPAFSLPTVERSGGAGTVAADGASYREIFDVSNWDRALVINTPGHQDSQAASSSATCCRSGPTTSTSIWRSRKRPSRRSRPTDSR